jgi:hypothetical protein
VNNDQTKLVNLLNKYIEKILVIDFYSDKKNLQDINSLNKDISIIFKNLDSAIEIVLNFNFKVSSNSRIKIQF